MSQAAANVKTPTAKADAGRPLAVGFGDGLGSDKTSKPPFKRLSEARGAVVCFLKVNPFSTSAEIYAATKVSIRSVLKKGMFKNPIYEGRRCWRVTSNPETKIN